MAFPTEKEQNDTRYERAMRLALAMLGAFEAENKEFLKDSPCPEKESLFAATIFYSQVFCHFLRGPHRDRGVKIVRLAFKTVDVEGLAPVGLSSVTIVGLKVG